MEVQIIKYPSVVFVAPEVFNKNSMINIVKNKTRLYNAVKIRQVIVWFLYKEGMSRTGIKELTGVKRSMIYYSIDKVNDLISVNDKDMIELINKINKAKERWQS